MTVVLGLRLGTGGGIGPGCGLEVRLGLKELACIDRGAGGEVSLGPLGMI